MQTRERGLYLLRRLLMTSSFSTVTEALGSARQSLLHTTSSLFGRLGGPSSPSGRFAFRCRAVVGAAARCSGAFLTRENSGLPSMDRNEPKCQNSL